ncbi:hypothetical protein K439DRAFT_1622767 [Ramaria rubella]|nr:hypothetical protein K439DRAFT_1622767 [Ramaria rubella]
MGHILNLCVKAILSQFAHKKAQAPGLHSIHVEDLGDDSSDIDGIFKPLDEHDLDAWLDVDTACKEADNDIISKLGCTIEQEHKLSAADVRLGEFTVTKIINPPPWASKEGLPE